MEATKEYYEGKFSRDKRDGEGKVITQKGEIYDTFYSNGELIKRSVIPKILDPKVHFKFMKKFLQARTIMEPKVTLIPE
jgi:hypothetical protein